MIDFTFFRLMAFVCMLNLAICHFGASAAEPPAPPDAWNPQLIQSLPPEAAQAMNGLPTHLCVQGFAEYCFGTAVGPDGSVYFTEYKGSLSRLMPDGELRVRPLKRGGAYGVAVDAEGNVFIGFDSDDQTGYILRISPTGEETRIVQGLSRPRQMTCDPQGNLLFILEIKQEIRRWNKADSSVETLLSELKSPQGVAASADGSVYFTEYGVFGPMGVALEPGSVSVRHPDGTVSKLASGFWRARGLARTSSGELIVASEANAWDQGNSGALFSVSPNGETKIIVPGLDYPQVPAAGPNGKIYFSVCRDNLIFAYDPASAFTASPWPGQAGIEAGVIGGSWQPDDNGEKGGSALKLDVNGLMLEGKAKANSPEQPLRIWVRIAADRLNLSLEPLPYPSAENNLPGIFRMPSLICHTAKRLSVMPERSHIRSRWPVRHNDAGTELAAEGFSEAPAAYLVYFEYFVPDTTKKGK